MTNINYELTDGTVVKTLKEAQTSGQGYKAIYTAIEEEPNLWFSSEGDKRIRV